jgi:lipopolysaccharide export system permease protein
MASLDRYILRQCFGVMIFVTAALSAAIWLAQSLRLIDLIVNRGLSIEVFLYLALLILPRFLDIVLPIGVFIAVLFTFNRLTAESELVVMRSVGLSHIALAKPVLILAGIAFLVLMSLSAYFLPASNRAFKDLHFEIRNRFVSSLLQEGTFTTIADKLTIYIRGRDEQGEVVGLLINDSREPHRPVTILAERGVFANTPAGSRIVMVNGNRQQFDPETSKLSLLTFDRYTLDLDSLHDAPVVRFREPQERFLDELFFPSAEADPVLRLGLTIEAHQRILIPLSAFSFALIPLACLLPGEFNRRGQLKRALLAIVVAFLFELLDIGVNGFQGPRVAAVNTP